MPADEEEEHVVAQANAPLDDEGHFTAERIPSRYRDTFPEARAGQIEYMDVSPKQVVSVATALIPFLEHDDANRALMGSNMQRQAVPLLEPESPIVGTGMEGRAARDSGQVLIARARRPRHERHRRARPRRDRRGRARRVQAPQVRAQQPGHLHQPAADRGRRRAHRRRPADRGLQLHPGGRAGPRPERPRGVHELGGRQLRGRHRHQRSARPRRPVHQHPHREARDRVPRHEARDPKRSPATSPTSARSPSRTSTRRASSTSGRSSGRATSWSARSPRRARPS